MTDNFEIIYKELKKIDQSQDNQGSLVVDEDEKSSAEINEIAELRRMILELNDPEPYTYTSS